MNPERQTIESANHLAIFQEQSIRRVWHNEEWWFSVVDVCGVLTDSADAGAYWRKLKQRLNVESAQPVTFCHGLKLLAPDDKQRVTDCANTEGIFRLVQSIPSPKAEPFKRWLAQVGYERVKEYAILTAEIARATFGVTPGEHSKLKALDTVKTANNLRDHMTDLELIFTMLGEAGTTEIAREKDAQGFAENALAAKSQAMRTGHWSRRAGAAWSVGKISWDCRRPIHPSSNRVRKKINPSAERLPR